MVVDEVIVKLEARIADYKAKMIEADRVSDRAFGNIQKGALRTGSSLASFAKGFAGAMSVGAVIALGAAFIGLADDAKRLEAQLRLATEQTGSFGRAQADVRRIAMDTATPLAETARLYAAIGRNANELGLTQTEVARITETVSKGFLVSGASAADAAQGTRQLIQALQSGVLRGDEFNSIMENAPRLARLFAESMGLPVSHLRALAEAGKLSTDVLVDGMARNQEAIRALDEEAAKIPMTFDRAMTLVHNAAMITFSAFDRGGEFSQMLADFVTGGAENFAALEARAEVAGGNLRAIFGGLANVFDPMGENAISVMGMIENEIEGLHRLIQNLFGTLDDLRNFVPGVANSIRNQMRESVLGQHLVGPNTPMSNMALRYRLGRARGEREAQRGRTERFVGGLPILSADTGYDPRGDRAAPPPQKPKRTGRKGPSAEELAKRAERERLQADAREYAFQQDLERLNADLFEARKAQLVAAEAIHQASLTEVEMARLRANAAVQQDVDQKRITEAQAQELIVLNDKLATERRTLLTLQEEERQRAEASEVAQAVAQGEVEIAEAQARTLRVREDQRRAAIDILNLQYELKRLQLEEIIASRTSTDAQKKIAQLQLDRLEGMRRSDQREIERQYRSPGENYLDELEQRAANLDDEIENIAVDKVRQLGDAFGDATAKAFGLKGAIGDLVSAFARLAFEQAIVLPLMRQIFGGGGGGGLGGLLGLFGGGSPSQGIGDLSSIYSGMPEFLIPRAGGGPVRAGGRYLVGERGIEEFRPTQSGTIVPNHALMPGGGGGQTAVVEVRVVGGEYFDARVERVSGPVAARVVSAAAPQIAEVAAAQSITKTGRPHL
jgi:tape measure domain-containing protein